MVRTEYVRQEIPLLPVRPVFYQVKWEKTGDRYGLDFDNAKNLLKNWELMDAYGKELKTILEGMK